MALLPVLLVGCSGNTQPELYPFTGTIEQDGKPVATGGLLFQPVSGSARYTHNATITANGRFAVQTELITAKETKLLSGIPAGTYRVTYHPPGDTQRSDLAVTLPEPIAVSQGGSNDAKLTLPSGAKLPAGKGEERDDANPPEMQPKKD